MKFEYQAWAMNSDNATVHGIWEEIIADSIRKAEVKAWNRAVYHLYTHNDNTIRMDYVKEVK